MPERIKWDEAGKRLYETGVKMGVLYVQDDSGSYPKGVAWNGLTNVQESPSGGEATSLYADDVKYLDLMSAEEFSATIEAYTYPDEFAECDGSKEIAPGMFVGQQSRKSFGFCYRTVLGNDIQSNDYSYKIHIVYGCKASPSEKSYASINDSPDANTFSWEAKGTPVSVASDDGSVKPTATIVIDASKFVESPNEGQGKLANLKRLEDILYGSSEADARLPLPDEIKSILSAS